MKINIELTEKSSKGVMTGALEQTQRTSGTSAPAKAGVAKQFRRLKRYELVTLGDFVADEHRGFKPWEGPSGFRADSFVKQIYRQDESRKTTNKKAK